LYNLEIGEPGSETTVSPSPMIINSDDANETYFD